MPDGRRLLITGAGGRLGAVLAKQLADEWSLRLVDCDEERLREVASCHNAEAVVCDVTRAPDVIRAMDGVDAVVHLAAISEEASPARLCAVNILGTTHVLDACLRCGVPQLVFASSNHVVGGYERFADTLPPDRIIGEDDPVWPDSHYGASKAHSEAVARWYVAASEGRLRVACLRIGTAGFSDVRALMRNQRAWSTWLSDRDCGQLVHAALTTHVPFGIYYGVSANTRRFWSLDAAERDLNYRPADDAERFVDEAQRECGGVPPYRFPQWMEEPPESPPLGDRRGTRP